MADDLDPVLARLDRIDDPLDRAIAAQEVLKRVQEVRDVAMSTTWARRRAGTTIGHLARSVGVSRAAAAVAVSRGGQG